MPKLATWLRPKDEPFFNPIFARYPEVAISNACAGQRELGDTDALLLTGGADVAAQFLKQEVPDPSILEGDVDPVRDEWELGAIAHAIDKGLPILAICKGLQILNVALGGTLRLDIRGHNLPEQKNSDIQALRIDRAAAHKFEKVNSSHHQAVDRVAPGFTVEAWSKGDDIIEQMRLADYPYCLAVQYHPERGTIYGELFDDFFDRFKG